MTPAEQEAGISYEQLGIKIGRVTGAYTRVYCPWCPERSAANQHRKELAVNLASGTWRCHHCGEIGGLKGEAHKRGIKPEQRIAGGTRIVSKPIRTAAPNKITKPIHTAAPAALDVLPEGQPQWMYDWCRDRRISKATVDAFGLTGHEFTDDKGQTQRAINFPYWVDGELVNVKRRIITTPNGKDFKLVTGADKSLFNIDRAEGAERVVIVEGEPDVLACHEVGWIAVTPPNGAPGKHVDKETGEVKIAAVGSKLDAFFEEKSAAVLKAAKRIVVAIDGDMEGEALAAAVIEHVGPERCWVVQWPEGCKDANDVLLKHGHERLEEVLSAARAADLPGITQLIDELDYLRGIRLHGYDSGYVIAAWPTFSEYFHVVLGSLITISGIPGNGKTSVVLDMFTKLAHEHGMRFGVFSPEAGNNGTLLGKLVQLVSDRPILPGTTGQISEEEMEAAAYWVNDHFWRIDAAAGGENDYGTLTVDQIIERLERLVLTKGINGAIIDPWNRLEAMRPGGMTETEYVAWAINKFSRFAKRHNVAMFIICHPHKMPDAKFGEEEPIPSPYHIAGSAHWYNMSDYILGVGRNKFTQPLNMTTVQIQKVREEGVAGRLGTVQFYYDGRSRRFVDDENAIPAHAGTNPYASPKRNRRLVEPVLAMPEHSGLEAAGD